MDYLLIFSVIIILAVIASRLSDKSGIPQLLLFIFMGIAFGYRGVFGFTFNDYDIANLICSLALIIIMFYGGFGTNWLVAKPVAFISLVLSTFGVVTTAIFSTLFLHFILKINIYESFLISAIISSTDAASVFSILRSKNLNLKYNTASLLEVESGSNDPMAFMLTLIAVNLITKSEISYGALIFKQFFFAIVFAVVISKITLYILNSVLDLESGFDNILVFSIVALTYAITDKFQGNGYLAVYIFGLIIGNSKLKNKYSLVHFFDGLTGLMQIAVFFLLGLLSDISSLFNNIWIVIFLAVFLALVARPLTIFIFMFNKKYPLKQKLLVSFAGLRGASAIVFATYAMTLPLNTEFDIYHIIFLTCVFSSLIQGWFLPMVSKKLEMIDESDTVFRTFNDYQEYVKMPLVQINVGHDHPWVNKSIQELNMTIELIVVMVLRNGKPITPRGNTRIKENDTVIISGHAYIDDTNSRLIEFTITNNHPWEGKYIKEIKLDENELIIMLIRDNGKVVVPDGGTIIKKFDKIVLNNFEE